MLSLIYKFFKSLDMYKAPATLRARGQADVGSFSLGLFSLVLLAIFMALLVSKLRKIIERDSDSISYSSTLSKDFEQRTIKDVMFGVTFEQSTSARNYSMNDFLSYYQVQALIWMESASKYEEFNLVPCNKSEWKLLGEEYQSIYDNSKLNRSFCLPKKMSVFTKNIDSAFAKIKIVRCNNQTQPSCKIDDREAYYAKVIQQKQSFPLYFSILTAYPQSNDKDPRKYYIYSPKFTTTKETGQQVFMYLDKFVIDTDVSLLPIIQQHEKVDAYTFSQNFYADFYLSDESIKSIFELEFFTSKNVITYNRQLQKIDSALSYVGGLFGLVFLFFNFFLKPFNEYRYELMASQSSFNYDSEGRRFRQKDFNIITFCKYRIFCWLNFFTCNKFKLKTYTEIDQTLTQSRKLLDVEKLFRRIQFMERVLQKKVNKSLLMSLTLVQQKSLLEVKKKRMVLDYYKQVINLEEAATVDDAVKKQGLFPYQQKMMQNQRKKNVGLQRLFTGETNDKIVSSLQDLSSRPQQIKQQLMQLLNLQNFPIQCQKVAQHVTLANDAQKFQFKNEDDDKQDPKDNNSQSAEQKEPTFEQVEKEITQAFISLDQSKKKQLLGQIPIKILHRMRITAKKLRKPQNPVSELLR